MRCRASALVVLLVTSSLTAQKPDAADLQKAAQEAVDEQRWTDAATAFGKLVEVSPKNARAWHMLGYTLHAAGELDKAMKAHLKATEFPEVAPIATYNIACVHALKGEKDAALEWLSKAVEAGFSNAEHLAMDTDMDSLRSDPRFTKIAKSMTNTPAKSGAMQTYANGNPRTSFRVLFWQGQGSPGQVVVDYGQPLWRDKFAEALDSPEHTNRRWRMGRDFWTTLDTNVDLDIGGTKVPAGYYYLTLEHQGDRAFKLALLDPSDVRAQKLDAYHAAKSKGGIEIPMQYSEYGEVADKLKIAIKMKNGGGTKGKLAVHFGPHMVTAPIAMHVTSY